VIPNFMSSMDRPRVAVIRGSHLSQSSRGNSVLLSRVSAPSTMKNVRGSN
jgi:hypothetical protein